MNGNLKIIRDVLLNESKAIEDASQCCSVEIEKAAILIAESQGRVIVSGVGKSGHIGKKIASTMTSLGKPSYFIHATEASHGDLGAVSQVDIILMLSNSGETAELSDFILYCEQNEIPIISITSNSNSTLAENSDVAIVFPMLPEACLLGQAPTTSSTTMLAIGDSLAVLVSHLLDVTKEKFKDFHPGGTLGARLLTVAELMHPLENLPIVAPKTPMHKAVTEMSSKGFGIILVKNEIDEKLGVITDGDLRRVGDKIWGYTAGDLANKQPICIQENSLISEAITIMSKEKVTSLISLNCKNLPSGLIHIHDCIKYSS